MALLACHLLGALPSDAFLVHLPASPYSLAELRTAVGECLQIPPSDLRLYKVTEPLSPSDTRISPESVSRVFRTAAASTVAAQPLQPAAVDALVDALLPCQVPLDEELRVPASDVFGRMFPDDVDKKTVHLLIYARSGCRLLPKPAFVREDTGRTCVSNAQRQSVVSTGSDTCLRCSSPPLFAQESLPPHEPPSYDISEHVLTHTNVVVSGRAGVSDVLRAPVNPPAEIDHVTVSSQSPLPVIPSSATTVTSVPNAPPGVSSNSTPGFATVPRALHRSHQHSTEKIIENLIANRTITHLRILLGSRGHRVPSLISQLESQVKSGHQTLRLIGSSANHYAGVGQYWNATDATVQIEGNVPLEKSARRLRVAGGRAERVRQHVVANGTVSLPMMGLMTSTCHDLKISTTEMKIDFEGEGGIATILATCKTWIYIGSDGASVTPSHLEALWAKQYAVAVHMAKLRPELIEPISDYHTPFGTVFCAQARLREGNPAAAYMNLSTFERRRGGVKVAHWVALKCWGLGTSFTERNTLLDPGLLTADCVARQREGYGRGVIPDFRQDMSWTMFSQCSPPLNLDLDGLHLGPGESTVLKDMHPANVTTRMAALMRVVDKVGSRVAMAACGYPHMPDKVSSRTLRDLCSFVTKRSNAALTALGSLLLQRGSKAAVTCLMVAASLGSRMGDGWENDLVQVRECPGGFLISEAQAAWKKGDADLTWLCLGGGKIRTVLGCSGDRLVGTATFVGSIGVMDGPETTIR